jgi:hypothetical protein
MSKVHGHCASLGIEELGRCSPLSLTVPQLSRPRPMPTLRDSAIHISALICPPTSGGPFGLDIKAASWGWALVHRHLFLLFRKGCVNFPCDINILGYRAHSISVPAGHHRKWERSVTSLCTCPSLWHVRLQYACLVGSSSDTAIMVQPYCGRTICLCDCMSACYESSEINDDHK